MTIRQMKSRKAAEPYNMPAGALNSDKDINDIILPHMRCSSDSCISNEIIYKYVESMTSALDDVILSVMVYFNYSLNSCEILIRYEERVLIKLKSNYSPYGVSSDDIVLTMKLSLVMLLMNVTNMF
ncbi:unnamed protein product [Schistosoma margrebowiei]|uniref:Uncharacterized protein n=1 Tax=Schistosoma margrebowiei TaxID=48269 RepID=A0A183MHV6_9TREM|nr:unnamed protein product [Schistosoma margrebowiei]